jgi:hypothetical protein
VQQLCSTNKKRPATITTTTILLVGLLLLITGIINMRWIIMNNNNTILVHEKSTTTTTTIATTNTNNNNIQQITFCSTTKIVGQQEIRALKSWLVYGSVLLFVDDIEGSEKMINEFSSHSSNNNNNNDMLHHNKIRLVKTPKNNNNINNGNSNNRLPQLNTILHEMEILTSTPLLAFINSDIVMTKFFNKIPLHELIEKDLILSSGRMECHLKQNSGDDNNNIIFAEDYDIQQPCEFAKGKDFFLFPRGFFKQRQIIIPPFILARPMWDNWIADVAHNDLVDGSAMFLVAHIYHGEQWLKRDTKTGKSLLDQMDKNKAFDVKLNHHLTRICCEATIDVSSICPYKPSDETGHGSFICPCKKRIDCLQYFLLVRSSYVLCGNNNNNSNEKWQITSRVKDFRTPFQLMIYDLEQQTKLLQSVRENGEWQHVVGCLSSTNNNNVVVPDRWS